MSDLMTLKEPLDTCADKAKLLDALKRAVAIRDQMGGAMYYNILNEEACKIAGRLLTLKHATRDELGKILGEGTYF